MIQNKLNFDILKNKKVFWGVFSALFLITSIVAGLILSQQVRKTKIGAAGVNLTLTTNNANPKVNDVITIAVAMDTKGMSVNGTELKINYDANKLIATSITPGGFLPNVFIPGTISSGSANIVLGCVIDNNGTHPVNGTGLVAQLTFTVKATGTSTITIDPTSKVSVSGQTTNNIGVLTPVQITAAVASSPSPTPSICGGIQGITCPTGKVCIYSDGTTRAPYPDASGTCQATNSCTGTGSCSFKFCPTMAPCPTGMACTMVMPPCITTGGSCLNNVCIPGPTSSPVPTPMMCGGIRGVTCPTGKVCIYSDGTTRPPFPDASGTCQIDVIRPIPSPTPTYCGGIQGITCPTGKVCIYSDGTTRPPFPDASGTCQVEVRPVPSPSPTPHADIQCLPTAVQVVNIGQSVSFHVIDTGRNVSNIIWTASNGTPKSGSGLSFTTKFTTSGSKTVTVTDGGPVTSCLVSVNSNTPTSTPSPTRTPSPVPTRSPSPSPSPVGTGYTMAQIATHNTVSNCWLLLSGKVYNVTNYISSHPGGTSVITSNCGKDATQAFAAIGHSNTAKNLLAQYLIGYLVSANTPTPVATRTPSPSPTNNHIAGDVDGNGIVNIVDVGILIDNFADDPLLDSRPDLNNDGKVNIVDLGIIIDNYPN